MMNTFLKRTTYNTGLAVLICMLILCGIYAIYAYRIHASNTEQAHPSIQGGLMVVAHHLQEAAPVLTSTPTPEPVQSVLPQQSVQQVSVLQDPVNLKYWQSYFKKLHQLPSR
jgi:hypothetical protein